MDIRFHNTLTHRTETFKPIETGHVYMYNCGPTVYDYAHIGNFRAFLFADLLRRFLELAGHEVHQVMNITDVGHMTDDQLADGGGEDKMEAAAKRLKESKKQGTALVENPDDPYAVAEYFTQAFIEDGMKLGLKVADEYPANMPRATEHVAKSMIPMIRTLIEKDHAYVADDGAVYFSVQSFPEYGKLSGNTLDQLKGGAGGRVQDSHQAHKRHPADFLLWKPDATHLMKWPSDWGEGYPGWHIECSAMALHMLSKLAGRELKVIDIHTGGEDNIFPHHECEIAQSCGATGQEHFARFWMHSRFLLVEGEKMSKSKGNFHTVRDVLEGKATGREVDPAVLRFELLKGHYRSNINFTAKGLADSAKAVTRIRNAARRATARNISLQLRSAREIANKYSVVDEFQCALSDDLNISEALGILFAYLKTDPVNLDELHDILLITNEVLGVLKLPESFRIVDNESGTHIGDFRKDVIELCFEIDNAREAKDYDKADAIRQQLIDAGYDVKTTKEGTVASKRLA